MAKRKKTDIVQLKLRMREALRKRLETAARGEEISLNSEMVRRLESSFLMGQNAFLLEALLAPGVQLELLRAISVVLRMAGPDWNKQPTSQAVAGAIAKLVALFAGELRPIEASFPNHSDKTSADHLAWAAVLIGRFHLASQHELHPETPLERLAKSVVSRNPVDAKEDDRETQS